MARRRSVTNRAQAAAYPRQRNGPTARTGSGPAEIIVMSRAASPKTARTTVLIEEWRLQDARRRPSRRSRTKSLVAIPAAGDRGQRGGTSEQRETADGPDVAGASLPHIPLRSAGMAAD
jgi:hypothetical protein